MEENNQKETSIRSTLTSILSILIGIFVLLSIFKNKKEEDPKPLQGEVKPLKKKGILQDSVKNIKDINKRQGSILAEIEKKKEITPSELYKLQPSVSTRTLRRDMDVLVSKGVVRQDGSTKSTKYTYIG